MYYTDGESFPCNLCTLDSPWGMTETNDGDIVICHPETHKVCIFDKKGRSKMTLKTSLSGNNLFLNPRCVCVNELNGDIIVSDFERHSILFFDKNGEYKFRYGSLGKSSGHLHHPCGVCADSNGNVIVADSDNHRVHLVSADGKFRRFILTQADGIDEPIAVCLTKEELLVVGQWSGKVIVLNY
ncbi:hypothetical protein LOTGIDRAFT_105134 [Lottia gigantea]|uniref:SMP-30/Gluconolactonase/LRE-like region domain-containing protein n=1 Tax=Lottia gigantea TaxID=225164 RepID=V4AAS5_LOTGI|nr:hypothetical protein LOTGIDRAFT_105134 [Lottia gigantea]ESO93872.1 hypothetical protein LOTGIDRAFT_105134 [Lottia gigantea]